MRLALHIGMGKAGSTAIQHSLYAARDVLFKGGCLYPLSRNFEHRHHWLVPLFFEDGSQVATIQQEMSFDPAKVSSLVKEEQGFLEKQICETSPDQLILSSEILFRRLKEDQLKVARNYLRSFTDNIEVFAYLRSPVSRYLSVVQQGLKSTNVIPQPGLTHYLRVIEDYETLFAQPVTLRVFERSLLRKNDVVNDFLDWVRAPVKPEAVTSIESNTSMSAEAMAVLQELSPDKRPANKSQVLYLKFLRGSVRQADKRIKKPTKPVLKEEITKWITEENVELLPLRDRYKIQFSDVDYNLVRKPRHQWRSSGSRRNAEITSVSQICDFNVSRKNKLKKKALKYLERKLANSTDGP